jgi:TPP-dependent pyruvate/acetoin dehydrogenase alpha subunit
VGRFRRYLQAKQLWSDEDDASFRRGIEAQFTTLLAEVEHLPPPPHATLFEDVYAEQPWNLREQQAFLQAELLARQPD